MSLLFAGSIGFNPVNEPNMSLEKPPKVTPQAAEAAPNQSVNPSLSAALKEGGDAVRDDLRQAKDLTAELEVQLAGRSKELLHLKFLLEQTKAHFGHMQDSVTAMRAERHKLANEAMKAQGLEIMLARMTAERDRLKSELEGVLEGLATENALKEQQSLRFDKRDKMIAELTFEVVTLRQEVADLRRMNAPVAPAPQERPLKTSASMGGRDEFVQDAVEVFPTERVVGLRGKS